MVLQDLARVLCQSDQSYSLHQRAIALFGFQVAILSPSTPVLESEARVLAALKILESIESDTVRNAGLEERLRIVGYRELLDLIMREGGARKLRSTWTTKELWDNVSARLKEAKDVALNRRRLRSQRSFNAYVVCPLFICRLNRSTQHRR
jgi:hypothetical protein